MRGWRAAMSASSASKSSARPPTTVCCGKLHAEIAQQCIAANSRAAPASSISASISPRPYSPINSPRVFTSFNAAEKSSDSAATSAVYSPRLCPAASAGDMFGRASAKARMHATECVSSAGCVWRVRLISAASPRKHNSAMS